MNIDGAIPGRRFSEKSLQTAAKAATTRAKRKHPLFAAVNLIPETTPAEIEAKRRLYANDMKRQTICSRLYFRRQRAKYISMLRLAGVPDRQITSWTKWVRQDYAGQYTYIADFWWQRVWEALGGAAVDRTWDKPFCRIFQGQRLISLKNPPENTLHGV